MEGNEQADALVEKGRKKGKQLAGIPEGIDAYVTTATKGNVSMEDTQVKRLISKRDKQAWNDKAKDLILCHRRYRSRHMAQESQTTQQNNHGPP